MVCLQVWKSQTRCSSWASGHRKTDSMWRILGHRLVGQLYFLPSMLVLLPCTFGCTSGRGSSMVTELEMLSPCLFVLSKWSLCSMYIYFILCISVVFYFLSLFPLTDCTNFFTALLQVAGPSIMLSAFWRPSSYTGSPTAPCHCSTFSRTAHTTGASLHMLPTMSTTHYSLLLPSHKCMSPWLSSW